MERACFWACILAAAAGQAGCEAVAPIYNPTQGGYAGASITAKNTWTAAGEMLSNPALAIDNNLATAARGQNGQANAELTIDLKRPCIFQTVVIEHGSDADAHARAVSVSTSGDGKLFLDRYAAPGTRRVTILSLPSPVMARYVRLKVVSPGVQPWNVAEVYLQ